MITPQKTGMVNMTNGKKKMMVKMITPQKTGMVNMTNGQVTMTVNMITPQKTGMVNMTNGQRMTMTVKMIILQMTGMINMTTHQMTVVEDGAGKSRRAGNVQCMAKTIVGGNPTAHAGKDLTATRCRSAT
jgi:hypothetical protein